MARDSAIPPESFEEILAWLNPNREVAGAMYVQLCRDLKKVFIWGRCPDPEGLTDEVVDRVARKVRDVRPTYEGDPRLYFLAVANNLIKENFRKIKTHVSLSDVDLSQHLTTEGENDDGFVAECLETCLEDLSPERRTMIIEYYAKEKMAKIEHRSQMAQRLGISVETLRVRVFRIRAALEECIGRCVERKAR